AAPQCQIDDLDIGLPESRSFGPLDGPHPGQSLTGGSSELFAPAVALAPANPVKSFLGASGVAGPSLASEDASSLGGTLANDGDTVSPSVDVPSTPTSGRQSAQVNRTLAVGYEQLEAVLTELIDKTSPSTQQIAEGWHKSRGRVINGTNHWNLYSKYFAKHEEQERRRLGLPLDAPSKLYRCTTQCLSCSDIEKSLRLPEVSCTTTLLKGAAAKHGFEAALVMCGKVVNEDASLGFAHTTAGATQFYETRCRSDPNTMIGHLKAHIYNTVSLELVSDTFDDNGEKPKENQPVPPWAPLAAQLVDVDDAKDSDKGMGDWIINYIKDTLMVIFKDKGVDMSKIKCSTFPWATLLTILATQGFVMENYLFDILMPVFLIDIGFTMHSKTGRSQSMIVGALAGSEIPVITSSAPPEDSMHPKGQQIYADGTIDHEGLPRLAPSTAATRVKRKPAAQRALPQEPIIISKVVVNKCGRTKAVLKKKPEVIVLDHSSEGEVASVLDITDSDNAVLNAHNDPLAGNSRKWKANDLPTTCASKKRAPTVEPELAQAPSKKGKERAVSVKIAVQPHRSAAIVDSSDSEDEFPEMISARVLAEERLRDGPSGLSQSRIPREPVDSKDDNPFRASHAPEKYVTPSNIVPGLFVIPESSQESSIEPSSPSPKRRQPLRPLTEYLHQPRASPGDDPHDGIVPPVPMPATSATDRSVSSTTPVAHTMSTAQVSSESAPAPPPTVSSSTTSPATPPPPPPLPPSLVGLTAPPPPPPKSMNSGNREGSYSVYGGFVDRRHQSSQLPERQEWLEPPRQQIGGGFPLHGGYHPQAHYFPYQGGDGNMIPPQHVMGDIRRGAPYHDGPGGGGGLRYHEMYRGDPHRMYGGFRGWEGLLGPAMYPNARESLPVYHTHMDELQSYRKAHNSQHLGPGAHLNPGPSSESHQPRLPYLRASIDPQEPAPM
ncbi:hypothetical protein HYDPIDRAFT_27972, partial [Hydnomerulius pinastri MD-312]